MSLGGEGSWAQPNISVKMGTRATHGQLFPVYVTSAVSLGMLE
jgi:hypothetical protein